MWCGCGQTFTLFYVGAEELADVTNGTDHVMLLGITCGFSAPYVAGQIDHAMQEVSTGIFPYTLSPGLKETVFLP